jgi:hypothetical protein
MPKVQELAHLLTLLLRGRIPAPNCGAVEWPGLPRPRSLAERSTVIVSYDSTGLLAIECYCVFKLPHLRSIYTCYRG